MINIKNTNLNVSELCMGGCPLGGYGWGNVEKTDLINAVKTAVDSGINFLIPPTPTAWAKAKELCQKHSAHA